MAIFTAIGSAVAAVSGWIGTTLAAGGLGAFMLRTAVGIGLNLLAQAIAGKPQDPKFSVNGTLQAGGDIPRSILFGYASTAGSLVYANTWGNADKTDNAFLTQVIALSDYPVRELREVWVNGELCTLGPTAHADYGFPVTQYAKDGRDHLWVKFYDGTQTAADPFLVSKVSSTERPYAADRIGRGVAYAVITALVTKNLFSGIPSFKFALYGARLYDLSRDTTVGGSGTHRWGDPSTWGGDGDFLPAVQTYNVLRGISYAGRWFYGIQGMSANRLPSEHWIAQVAKCRAQINSADGMVPTYRSGGEIGVDAPIGDAVEALLTTCQGRVSETGGIYKLFLGAPGTPVMSFTDGEILSTEEQSFTPFFGLADTINGISARYPSPAEAWNTKVAPPLFRPDLEVLAGNRRLMADVSLDFVPYAEQVQRLMKSALEEAQRARRHTLVLSPEYWALEPGDVVAWTSERNGYINKLFRVDGVVDRANLDVMIDLTEVDPADYDWDSDAEFKPPTDGRLEPKRPQPQPIIDWFAEPWQIEDANGTPRRPAIRLAWNGEQPDVAAVAFEVALAETMEVFHRGRTDEVSVGSIVTSQGLLPAEDYLVRGRYVPESDRETLWSSWLPVTTLDIRLSGDDVYLPGMVDELLEELEGYHEWLGDGTRELIDQSRRNVLLDIEEDVAGYTDRQLIRREVVSTGEGVRASAMDALLAATGPDSALVQAMTALDAALSGKASLTALTLLQGEVSYQAGILTATANALTALDVQVGGFSASGRFRTTVEATPSGALGRIGLSVSATSGGATSTAALFLDALSGGQSRVVVNADQFAVVNGSAVQNPFIVSGGVVRMNVAHIGTVTAGILQSANGKMIISLNAGTIEIYS